MRSFKPEYLNFYHKVQLIQPVKTGDIIETYELVNNQWVLTYSTTTIYNICPYDGQFRDCKACGIHEPDFDVEFCLNKQNVFSAGAVCGRINRCLEVGLAVRLYEKEDNGGA